MVVRSDIKMGRGKTAVQVAHAAVMASEVASSSHRAWYESWRSSGQAKICLKVSGLGELDRVYEKALKERLPVVRVEDKGLTQLQPGTVTCIGIGPAPEEIVDRVTGDLKLL
jgi:PTH2 family peptidyl-tRNA hydrolase